MNATSPATSVLGDVATWPGIRTQVLAARRAKEWFSNWVSKPLVNDTDVQDGIALLRETYDKLRAG